MVISPTWPTIAVAVPALPTRRLAGMRSIETTAANMQREYSTLYDTKN